MRPTESGRGDAQKGRALSGILRGSRTAALLAKGHRDGEDDGAEWRPESSESDYGELESGKRKGNVSEDQILTRIALEGTASAGMAGRRHDGARTAAARAEGKRSATVIPGLPQ